MPTKTKKTEKWEKEIDGNPQFVAVMIGYALAISQMEHYRSIKNRTKKQKEQLRKACELKDVQYKRVKAFIAKTLQQERDSFDKVLEEIVGEEYLQKIPKGYQKKEDIIKLGHYACGYAGAKKEVSKAISTAQKRIK